MTEHLDMATLSAYLDDELTAADQSHACAHLAVCPQCRGTLAELDKLSQDLRALACPALPAELQARLQRPFRQPPERTWWSRHWAHTVGAAASILLGLLIGSALPGQPPSASPSHNMLAVLGNAPPGALCARPEFCYLKVNLK
ncbi:anti-sigma factor family protein [Stutzerimonas xanthomarina]|uniref:anti-sigma factor family protein n=1 Tax=Stutzerimonas xanthomarina TaxID=271420 RepID=UPI003AA9B85E